MTQGWCLYKPQARMVCTWHTPGYESGWQRVPSYEPPLLFATRREAREVAAQINQGCATRGRWAEHERCVVRRFEKGEVSQ